MEAFAGQLDRAQGRSAYWLPVIAIAVVLSMLAAVLLAKGLAFPLDDAYITLHNANVLRAGVDRNFPGVSPLYGSTSLVHLALVSFVSVAINPPLASTLICLAAAMLYLLGIRSLAAELGASDRLAVAAIVVGGLSGLTPYHLLNGLETGLALAIVTWALLFATRSTPSIWFPILCGLMPFVRPELGLLAAALFTRHAVLYWHRKTLLLRDLAVMILVATPWFGWQVVATGTLLPSTAGAKAAFFADGMRPIIDKLFLFLTALPLLAIFPCVSGLCFIPRTSIAMCSAAFLVLTMAIFTWQIPGWMHHNLARYAQIFTPVTLLLLLSAAKHDRLPKTILFSFAALSAATSIYAFDLLASGKAHTEVTLVPTAEWANANLPSNAVVLIHDAGYIAYATDLRLEDLVGLKSPGNIALHKQITYPSIGLRRGDAVCEIAASSKATHAIILNDAGEFWSQSATYLRQCGWNLTSMRSAKSLEDYSVLRIAPPP